MNKEQLQFKALNEKIEKVRKFLLKTGLDEKTPTYKDFREIAAYARIKCYLEIREND